MIHVSWPLFTFLAELGVCMACGDVVEPFELRCRSCIRDGRPRRIGPPRPPPLDSNPETERDPRPLGGRAGPGSPPQLD